MRFAELLAIGYFTLMAVLALLLVRRRPGWWRTLGLALAGMLVALATSKAGVVAVPLGMLDLRDWGLLVALPIAYWTPAPLAGAPHQAFERWLVDLDRRLGIDEARANAPLLELAYLLVYPMVPAGLAAVLAAGDPTTVAVFWPAVLLAVLPCYGLLPLVATRPPRALLMPASPARPRGPVCKVVRRMNVRFLATFSVGWNTLPSGHTAGAMAIAIVVWRSGSILGPLFALLAIGIALGTVRGRYHYAVDTVLGAALGVLSGIIV
jgi:membrane-associated phospholipid phosphatase